MSLALLFAGQGAQRSAWAAPFCGSPAARALYEEADRVLGWDLTEVSFEGPDAELPRPRSASPPCMSTGWPWSRHFGRPGRRIPAVLCPRPEPGRVHGLRGGRSVRLRRRAADGRRARRLMQEACERTVGGMAAIVGRGARPGALPGVRHRGGQFQRPGADHPLRGEAQGGGGGRRRQGPRHQEGRPAQRRRGLPQPADGARAGRLRRVPRGSGVRRPPVPRLHEHDRPAISDPAAIKEALGRQLVSPVLWEDCMRSAAAAGRRNSGSSAPGAS